MKPGDLIDFCSMSGRAASLGVRGYDSFPGDYGFHQVTWVKDCLGLVLEKRDTFLCVLIQGKQLWFESNQLVFSSVKLIT